MFPLRARSVLLAVTLVAATATLTACQSDSNDDASPSTASTGTESGTGASDPTGSKPTETQDSGGTDRTDAPSAPGSADPGSGKGDKGVSGTWFGKVSYLAPGKFTVSGPKGEEQAFLTSTDTEIWGAGDICGDEGGQSATKCTEQQLETAARKGVDAEVKVSEGIATRITEDH